LETETDVSGWQSYSAKIDKERRWNGQVKDWSDGEIYIGGGSKYNEKTEGNLYKLQEDGTHTLFHVKYGKKELRDYYGEIERKEISKGHKMA
jgi:hypothetical protein